MALKIFVYSKNVLFSFLNLWLAFLINLVSAQHHQTFCLEPNLEMMHLVS